MNIFNSLGSNYSLGFALKALLTPNKKEYSLELKKFLEEKYDGKAILLYKGRQAMGLMLKILNLPKESVVTINGFTCFAVYKAIESAGYGVECLDIEPNDLNFTADELRQTIKQNPNIKVVVVQNTLGSPADIENIAKICKEHDLILVEDLPHCVGTVYKNDKEAGTVGDFVTLSFSQDKMIDAVSGGALIIRNKQFGNRTIEQLNNIDNKQELIDRLYPLLTFKIRKTYPTDIGKFLHFFLKSFDLLSKPMREDLYDFYSLPNWYCSLILSGFKELGTNLEHRKKIANIYNSMLPKKILQSRIANLIDFSSNLRFPVFIENRKRLINLLKIEGVYVSDIWYDSVSPDCPNAVNISAKILNLPTHKNVSENDAREIAQKINQWLQ